ALVSASLCASHHHRPLRSAPFPYTTLFRSWTALLVHDLSEGPRRFSELEFSCSGISPRTLSERLRALEQEGIVVRRSYAESPPRSEEHTSELQSPYDLVCRLLLEKKKSAGT